MADPRHGQLGAYLRTGLALLAVLVFWGALARDLWPALLRSGLQVLGLARQSGPQVIWSDRLEVRNHSTADAALVRETVARLEADAEAIAPHVPWAGSRRIPVLISDGTGPALTDGARLLAYHDEGEIELSTAPVLLAALAEGELSMPGLSVFAEWSYALYVAEAAGRTGDLLGEKTDAWVALMAREGTLPLLVESVDMGMPRTQAETARALRALLAGASMMDWLADVYGRPSLQALRDGQPLEEITGLPIHQLEAAWLDSLAGVEAPPTCKAAVPMRSPLRPYCDALTGSVGERSPTVN